ncbi:hypothetical protein M5J15_02455 [Serratia symbiotica]|uniref:hypothetical protein n=1 Tax=Serratia symbiotica TaxID=138074 RepID=UPI001D2F141A|nr:hypothetical protein [Serratia symbiotica]NIG87532.1 hypothetical protein [Serratia symbiotica]USS96057.1 hypothetical protein M5J15_02455 [Serratia symbiotica]
MPLSSFCGQDAALLGILPQATLQRHFRHLAEQVIHLPQVGLGDLCQVLPALAGVIADFQYVAVLRQLLLNDEVYYSWSGIATRFFILTALA